MNIFLAPLWLVLDVTGADDEDLPVGPSGEVLPPPPPPLSRVIVAFLSVGTLICIGVLGMGCYFVTEGSAGDVTLSGLGLELKTGNAGLAMIAIALLFYLLIGRLVMKAHKGQEGW